MLGRGLILWLMLSSFVAGQGRVKVYATVDANRITLNETVTLKVTAEGSSGYPRLDVSNLQDFAVLSGPSQSSSFQIINGKMSSSRSLSWTLIPNKLGNLTVPALDVEVDGKSYATKPINITVVRAQAQRRRVKPKGSKGETARPDAQESETPFVFLRAEPDKSEAYLGEQITVHYKLYTRLNVRNYSIQKPQGVGFWLEELYYPKNPSLRETRINGIRYQVATIYKTALFPTKTGELVLDPLVLSCTVELPSRSRFSFPFDDFFSDPFFSKTEQKTVRSGLLTLNIKPPPPKGRPEDFSGAVGEFRLSASLDTNSAEIGQAISYSVELSGTGNLSLFDLDAPSFPAGIEVLDRKSSFERDAFRDDVSGTKRWEYDIIPRRAGRLVIPKMELVYFHPGKEKWERTSTQPLTLLVKSGEGVVGRVPGLTKEEVSRHRRNILRIRTGPVQFIPVGQWVFPKTFLVLGLLGLTLFITPGVVNAVRTNREERRSITRARGALRKTLRRLRKVRKPDAFGELSSAVYAYFGDRFDTHHAALDARAVRGFLSGRVEKHDIDELTDILSICDRAQFTPGRLVENEKDAVALASELSRLLKQIDDRLWDSGR